jgi:hypothetical protein
MAVGLRLASFVAGPQNEGRGFRILAHSGLPSDTSWQGNFPLTLLEWAKLRAPEGFVGRFRVSGGAIAVRVAYLGEGAAGPIARANGIFIPGHLLERAIAHERALIEAIPPVDHSNSFADAPVEIAEAAQTHGAFPLWPALGLAWSDRQILADSLWSLDDVALKALESIHPPAQAARIVGWSTSADLLARGDFMPLQYANLIVTGPSGPLFEAARLIPCSVDQDGKFTGEAMAPPPAFNLWEKLAGAGRAIIGNGFVDGDLLDWQMKMANWSERDLAWHLIEVTSQHRLPYGKMIDVFAAIALTAGDDVTAAILTSYLCAVATKDGEALPELLMRARSGLSSSPACLAALSAFIVANPADSILDRMDEAQLMDAILTFENKIRKAGTRDWLENSRAFLEMLDARSVELANGRPESERRAHLSMLNLFLNIGGHPRRAPANWDEAQQWLRRRQTMPDKAAASRPTGP